MPTLNPQALNDEEYAMLKSIKERMKARTWKDLWILLAQYYDGRDGHTLTKEQAAKLIQDIEKEKSTEKEVIDTSEMEKFEARLKALETTPKEGRSEPRMTKEDIMRHLETCTDPNCEYRMIAQAIRELDAGKKPMEFLEVDGKHFTMSQIPEIKNMLREAEETGAKVRIFYHQGDYVSKLFSRGWAMDYVSSFDMCLKAALEESLKK